MRRTPSLVGVAQCVAAAFLAPPLAPLAAPLATSGGGTLSAQATWTVDARPAIEIPGSAADGSLLFTTASWAAPMADGAVVITDGPEGQIKIVGADGAVRVTIGRRGGGPGEFRDLVWAAQCADSLYAWDSMTGQVSVFSLDGRYVRQFGVPDARSSRQAACGPGGRFAAMSMPEQTGPREADEKGKTNQGGEFEVHRMRASVLAADRGGAISTRIAGVRWGEVIVGTLGPGGGRGALPRPLGGRTLFALAADALVVAESDSARVSWYGVDGTLRGRASVPRSSQAPTAADYERAIAPSMVGAPAAMMETIAAFARAVPPPATLPPLTGLALDPQGLAWVTTSPDGAPRTRLRAFASDGRAIATLEIPAPVTLFAVTRDLVLGRTENADGEHVVVAYRFRRP
jgi:hypothetical protein